MGMAAPIYWTAEMVRALPDDGNRYELVHGELLVSPSPRLWHQRLVGRLHLALGEYLRGHPVGEVLIAPADISWGDEHVLTQPDIFVLPALASSTEHWKDLRHLLLVAEVLSSSTARNDRFVKRPEYQRRGVPTVWLIEGDDRYVEVWTPEAAFPVIVRERLIWHPDGAREPFTLELAQLFGPAQPA